MRKLQFIRVAALMGALVLGGCGNFGKDADKPNRENATIIHEKEKEGGSLETGGGYGFTSFDLDIGVDGKDAIEAGYKIDKKLDVEYDNKLTNVKLTNNKAMDELDKLFMDILITKDTPPQEVIDKVLKWYGLEGYSKFDLEVDFDDGTILDIKEVK